MQRSPSGLQDHADVSMECTLQASHSLVLILYCSIHLVRCDLNEPIFDQLGDATDTFHLLHHIDFIQGFFISPDGPVVLYDILLPILPRKIANSAAAHLKTLSGKNNFQNIVMMVLDSYFPDRLWQRFEERILRDLYRELHQEVIFISGFTLGRLCAL